MNLLNEEIFGPILPVFFVDSDAEAFNLVDKNQRPLAFYWFGDQKEPRQKWLKNIVAGGVTDKRLFTTLRPKRFTLWRRFL